MHYFLPERCFESDLSALQAQVGEKPILLEEFGLHTQSSAPGSPHTETEQAAYYNAFLSPGEAYNIAGYSFWTLNDFSYVRPDMPDSEKCMGVLRNSLVSTCQVTTTQDYTEKPAAETIRRHYAEHVAYLDLFDSWVDPNTDLPPAGWSDNWQEGGVLMRGYKPSNRLWSHDLGRVALSKFVTGSTSITGTALSPALVNVNVDRYSILAGQVFSYSIRDSGRDSILYVGVKEGSQITPLLTIMPTTTLPYTFAVDLHQSPLNWSGNRTFSIVLQLIPQTGDGYSASYELDWIGLLAAPKAGFAAWPTIGIAPMTVAFTNTSTGDSMQSQWSFGDGVTSTLDSPTHTYLTRGSYTVTLAVNGLGGVDTLTRTNYITAYATSHADFTGSPALGVTPMTVVFTNTSTGDYSTSLWNFGDNLTSPLPSPTHTYTTQGVYTVTLTVSGPGGVDTVTRTNYITAYEPVQANFTARPVSGLVPLTTVFTNTSTGDYTESLWSLGDGAISALQNPTHTYTATGVYTVGLTIIKRLGTLVLPGHISTLTRTQYITVYAPVQPGAGFTAAPTSGIRPLAVIFTDTSTGAVSAWLWDFGDDVTSTKQHPTHTYTVTGVYTVTLTVSGPSGSDTDSKTSLITVRYGAYLPIVLREYAQLFEMALSLDGVDDYASALDSASLDLGTGDNGDFTIETFFYVPDLTNTGTNILVLKPGAYGLYIIYNASKPDRLIFRIWLDPSNYVDLHYDVNLSVGWHHIAAVFDNENTTSQDLVALYLDGSLVASNNQADWTSGIPDSISALNIRAYLGVSPTVCWIEEMRFSDIVRYSSVSYTVPTAPFVNDVNTRALWHFNEASGSTVFADSSSNGNTLTGQNGAHTGSP
jgi:PKD repeat protein